MYFSSVVLCRSISIAAHVGSDMAHLLSGRNRQTCDLRRPWRWKAFQPHIALAFWTGSGREDGKYTSCVIADEADPAWLQQPCCIEMVCCDWVTAQAWIRVESAVPEATICQTWHTDDDAAQYYRCPLLQVKKEIRAYMPRPCGPIFVA